MKVSDLSSKFWWFLGLVLLVPAVGWAVYKYMKKGTSSPTPSEKGRRA